MFKNIVVAHDGSDCSDRAFDQAIALAKVFDSTVTVCHVIYVDSKATAHHILEYAQEAAIRVKVRDVFGLPDRAIRDIAKDAGADLIVLGTHQRRGFQRLLAPSVSEHIVRDVHVPVLIVPSNSVDREEKERHYVNTARA